MLSWHGVGYLFHGACTIMHAWNKHGHAERTKSSYFLTLSHKTRELHVVLHSQTSITYEI